MRCLLVRDQAGASLFSSLVTSTSLTVPQDHLMPIGLSGLCPAVEKKMISNSECCTLEIPAATYCPLDKFLPI
jgi:hypothetical protein